MGAGAIMSDINREATLREVLAEVSLLDLGALIKKVLMQLGCFGLFGAAGLLLEGSFGMANLGMPNLGVPDWAYWLFFIWIAIAVYTSGKSYHQFAWYFPRAGWLGAIPLAAYLLLGIELSRAISPKADASVRAALFGLWLLWLTVFVLGLGILEIGHNRLMEKRAARRETEETAT